jgi:hypothetical protein
MSSSSNGVPMRMQFSSVRNMLGWFNRVTASLCLLSMFLIHFLACSWGSIIRGHRLPRVTRMALSVDTLSVGRPLICHSRT